MYAQTVKIGQYQFSIRGAYRMLREHNHFGRLESIRLAFWLCYGNEMMPPGEMRSWFKQQYEKHPLAFGIALGVWAYVLIIFVLHMLVPHLCTW